MNEIHGSFSAKSKSFQDFVNTWLATTSQPFQDFANILQPPASSRDPIAPWRLVQQVLNLGFGFFFSDQGKKEPSARVPF